MLLKSKEGPKTAFLFDSIALVFRHICISNLLQMLTKAVNKEERSIFWYASQYYEAQATKYKKTSDFSVNFYDLTAQFWVHWDF